MMWPVGKSAELMISDSVDLIPKATNNNNKNKKILNNFTANTPI